MNFDQLGKQHVSRRRKPSPLKNTRRSPASFDASFHQKVWKRPGRTEHTYKRPKIFGFTLSMEWLHKPLIQYIAIGVFFLAAGLVVLHWDSISVIFTSQGVSVASLQDTGTPPIIQEALFDTVSLQELSPPIRPAENLPLDLTEPFTWTGYTVQQGDTTSGIASRFSLEIDTIIAFNNITQAWNLQIGRTLRIPNMDGIPYKVQKNDSLSKIAAVMKVPQNAILDANNLQSDTIRVGEILFIPGAKMNANELKQAISKAPAASAAPAKTMAYPVPGKLTSNYGWRLDPVNPQSGVTRFHHAVDLIGNSGDPVKAAMKGTVLNTDHNPNLGNFIILGHGEYQTLYAHLSEFSVKTGDSVDQGQQIGKVGNTGYTTNPHLHFEVFRNGKRINPLEVLKK